MGRAAQINIDWDKIKRDREARERAVFCTSNPKLNPDGYKLAVNNKVLNAVYTMCIQKYGIVLPVGRAERRTWELNVWRIIQTAYREMYKYDLVHPVKGSWQQSQLEECVRCLDPDKMFQDLTADGNPFKEEVIKNNTREN